MFADASIGATWRASAFWIKAARLVPRFPAAAERRTRQVGKGNSTDQLSRQTRIPSRESVESEAFYVPA